MYSLSKRSSLKEIAQKAFYYVYPPVGWDPLYKTFNGVHIKKTTDLDHADHEFNILKHLKHYRTTISSFFALNNRRQPLKHKIKGSTLFQNFIGWNMNLPTAAKAALIPFWVCFNVITGLYVFTYNILKFFTEFLPVLGAKACKQLAANLKEKENHFRLSAKTDPSKRFSLYPALLRVGYLLLKAGESICRIIHFVGRAYTSPAVGIRAGWKMGNGLSKNKAIGTMLGFMMAGLSAAVTISIFLLTLPLTAKLYAPLFAKLVTAGGKAGPLAILLSGLYERVKPALETLGKLFMPAIQFIHFQFQALQIGQAVISCISMIASGAVINQCKMAIGNWFHRKGVERLAKKTETAPTASSTLASATALAERSGSTTKDFLSGSSVDADEAAGKEAEPIDATAARLVVALGSTDPESGIISAKVDASSQVAAPAHGEFSPH